MWAAKSIDKQLNNGVMLVTVSFTNGVSTLIYTIPTNSLADLTTRVNNDKNGLNNPAVKLSDSNALLAFFNGYDLGPI
jgi:hypothetical protein